MEKKEEIRRGELVVHTPETGPMDCEVLYDFAGALTALNRGYSVARASWGNPGKFVFLWSTEEVWDPELGRKVPIEPFLMWKNDKGKFVPWTPSQDAILAKDWFIGKSGQWRDGQAAPMKTSEVHVVVSYAGIELVTGDTGEAEAKIVELSRLAAYADDKDLRIESWRDGVQL